MSLPAVRALKQRSPGTEITVCCRDNLTAMWVARDEIDEVIPFKKGLKPLRWVESFGGTGSLMKVCCFPIHFAPLELRLGGVNKLTAISATGAGCCLKTQSANLKQVVTRRITFTAICISPRQWGQIFLISMTCSRFPRPRHR